MELSKEYMLDRIKRLQQEFRQADEHAKMILGALKEAENNYKLLGVEVNLQKAETPPAPVEPKGKKNGKNAKD